MAKKKVVVKVYNMNGRKLKCWLCPKFGARDNRSEALKIAATVPVELTENLRKNVGHAKLEAVEEVKEKKEEQKPQAAEPQVVVAHPPTYIWTESEPEPVCCTIM
ncbi:uncharacterized protein LOC108957608 isoform X2 [Eucalyptus grandis]|uniref:uncharacterized protein LOC108957608 isoform X2 n=1 Tax=Eucalyptus grandis TaxID=71139 RepID=UPI00192E7F7C|nr:uncharacterized protein LOC108957608 isoform X2 [Eucalyptus grandis]